VDDSTEFENLITENDDNVNSKDLVTVKKEDKVDVNLLLLVKRNESVS